MNVAPLPLMCSGSPSCALALGTALGGLVPRLALCPGYERAMGLLKCTCGGAGREGKWLFAPDPMEGSAFPGLCGKGHRRPAAQNLPEADGFCWETPR